MVQYSWLGKEEVALLKAEGRGGNDTEQKVAMYHFETRAAPPPSGYRPGV